MTFLLNHLWQSTLFAGVAGVLTLVLRRNQARTRYWLWVAASLKFLLPFSLLVVMGNHFEWRAAPAVTEPSVFFTMEISQPFAAAASAVMPKPAAFPMADALAVVWALGFLAVVLYWGRQWSRLRAAVRAAAPLRLAFPVPVRSSSGLIEPGVFGIFRPVLVLPQGIADRLTPTQMEAILAHELCHVRHRDNLAATIHMFVEAIFWFHPLIWWMGARLVEERERACDEEVLRLGNEPQVYAEGILSVCEFYLESPLTCAAGVTGSDLKKRMERIMRHRAAEALNGWKMIVLVTAGAAAMTVPVLVGALTAPPRLMAQSPASSSARFDVASVKLSRSGNPTGNVDLKPGRFRGTDLALQWLILVAYRIPSFQLSGDLPGWTLSRRYNIDAKADTATSDDQTLLMLQRLLEARFQLKIHRQTKEGPVYFLSVAKGGVKMEAGTCVPSKEDFPNECWSSRGEGLVQTLDWRGARISAPAGVSYRSLAEQLSGNLRRPVIDRTGLTRTFDIHLRWARDPAPAAVPQGDAGAPAPSAEGTAPSIFTAVEEQLGLKLQSGRGPVEYLIVDHVEEPSPN